MGFLTSLFGGETNYLTIIVALAIVLALIVLAVWLLKVLGQATQSVGRGRQRRLAIVDSIAIDQKRQAVIIRRDGVEHLIVVGGPNDLVVESGFEAPPLPAAQGRPARRMMPPSATSETEAPASNVARIDPAAGRGRPTSLRHTGLLRGGEKADDELPGGKREPFAAEAPDSATSGLNDRHEPEFETVAQVGEADSADTDKGRHN